MVDARSTLTESVTWYHDNIMKKIERTQTGVRLERRTLKVLKGTAEYLDISLAELIECMALHAFDGKKIFNPRTLEKIQQLRVVYDLDLTSADSHQLHEDFL